MQTYLYEKRARRARRQPDPDGAEFVGWSEAGYAVRDPAAAGSIVVLYRGEAADLLGVSVELLDLFALLARHGLPMPNQSPPKQSTPTKVRRRPVPRLEPRARITGKKRATVRTFVAARYEQDGASIRTIAKQLGRSYGFVLDLLDEAEVQLRPPSVNSGPGRRT